MEERTTIEDDDNDIIEIEKEAKKEPIKQAEELE